MFGPEKTTLVNVIGTPVGTALNPLYVIPSGGTAPSISSQKSFGPEKITLIDSIGTPVGTTSNILYVVKV